LKKIFLALFILLSLNITAQPEFSSISSKPGAFSRMGFGARGMGMGNAMSAITDGNLVSYYNPALNSFQKGNSFQSTYSFLSLDRSLNFINFTKSFPMGRKQNEDGTYTKPRSVAGLSLGIINAGVSDIIEYDNSGNKTGETSTSENQFFLSVSNRFSDKLALGIGFKYYYYKLYDDVTSTSFGADIGLLYILNKNVNIAIAVVDLLSKYEWDTSEIYGQSGRNTEDKFPLLKKIGLAYKSDDRDLILSAELEGSNAETTFLRFGGEYNIFENLFLRAGLDKLNLQNRDFPARPSCGFSYFHNLRSTKIGIDYAFVLEPYSSADRHIVGVNIIF
jgi:hypothetical protein